MSSSSRDTKSLKNLPDIDDDLLIESDDDDGDDTLNLISQHLSSIPREIALNQAPFVTTLLLTNNTLKSLKDLECFANLVSLQLDRNNLNNLKHFPSLPKLKTLWLNNNNLVNVSSLLSILKKQTPHLEYLSLLCNPLCPALNEADSDRDKDVDKSYRLRVINCLLTLEYLDTDPVTKQEREEAKHMDDVSDDEQKEKEPVSPSPKMPKLSNVSSGSDSERVRQKMKRIRNKRDKMVDYDMKGETFRVYSYYKPTKMIGKGAYGVVCAALDERNNKRIAIKKCKYVFDGLHSAKNTLREIKLLSHFTKNRRSADVIEIYDCISPTMEEIDSFQNIYIVMPYYDSNLLDIIDSKQTLSHSHFQYIIYQILRGLKCLHSSGVIHRDIKPENILINVNDCKIKIIDFGSSRGVNTKQPDANNTEYVCTRWYRAPEVMCNVGQYNTKMDIWSVGCILAEMILRKPLFPGSNYVDQLERVFQTMNASANDHDAVSTEWIKNQQAKHWIMYHLQDQSEEKKQGKSLTEMILKTFNNDDNESVLQCIDLLHRLLALNPEHRLSAKEALFHPYFKSYFENDKAHNHIVMDENDSRKPFDLSVQFEKRMSTFFGLRHLMQCELHKIHQKRWAKIMKKKRNIKKKGREQRLLTTNFHLETVPI